MEDSAAMERDGPSNGEAATTRADGSLPRPWYEVWARMLCNTVLSFGPLPKHIGFIMDGNRRFAQKNSMEKLFGHTMGFNKLKEALEWCLELGVEVVTVYAFSIENFKRSPDEVNTLMHLAAEKFEELLNHEDIIHKYGVSVRVLGDISLVPEYLQHSMARAINNTRNNTKAVLNVCFSYTARAEIVTAAKTLATGVQDGLLQTEDITDELLEECLYTYDCPPLDLLIRTSGEKRLSDFLLWQCGHSCLSFVNTLWPEFSARDLYAAVLFYQHNHAHLQERRREYELARQHRKREELASLLSSIAGSSMSETSTLQKPGSGIAPVRNTRVSLESVRESEQAAAASAQRQQHFLDVTRQQHASLVASLGVKETLSS